MSRVNLSSKPGHHTRAFFQGSGMLPMCRPHSTRVVGAVQCKMDQFRPCSTGKENCILKSTKVRQKATVLHLFLQCTNGKHNCCAISANCSLLNSNWWDPVRNLLCNLPCPVATSDRERLDTVHARQHGWFNATNAHVLRNHTHPAVTPRKPNPSDCHTVTSIVG